ncbi:amino acid adenylation domain-containing protein [Bacillus velezensis]|uniref:amino acid adenylation domain-containing protein n=1 Tax=Bacillus velezensis TaxID=492670 RepID=UPI003EE57C91
MKTKNLNETLDELLTIVSKITKINKSEIDINENLVEMGMDSIVFTKINYSIIQHFNVEIPFSKVYEELTDLYKIAEYLSEKTKYQSILNKTTTTQPLKIGKIEESTTVIKADKETIIQETSNRYKDIHELITKVKARTKSKDIKREADETFLCEIPLTKEQESILVQHDLSEKAFNESIALRIHGKINISFLEKAINKVVERHESLRTKINKEARMQQLLKEQFIPLKVVKDSGLYTNQIVTEFAEQPFKLSESLFRALLVEEAENQSVFVLVIHHIIADGWSIGVLLNEITEIYNSISIGDMPKMDDPLQFREFIQVRDEWLCMNEDKGTTFREKYHSKTDNFMDLNFNHQPKRKEYVGARLDLIENKETFDQVRKISAKNNMSFFHTMFSSFIALISKVSQSQHISIGVPFAGQNIINIDNLIGNCVEMIGVHLDVEETDDLVSLSQKVSQFLKELDESSYLHKQNAEQSYNVVFNMIKNVNNSFNETECEFYPITISESKYDLFLTIIEFNSQVILRFDYNKEVLSDKTITRWAGYFKGILKAIIEEDLTVISEMNVVSNEEEVNILNHYSSFSYEYINSLAGINLSQYGLSNGEEAKVFILDQNMQLLPTGMVGEIYIGPNTTEIYNTNLLGKINEEGQLTVLGEEEKQFVLKGRKVSLYKIEEHIRRNSKIKDVLCEYDAQKLDLIAYITLNETINDASELVKGLRKNLPAFMIPTSFIKVSNLENRADSVILDFYEQLTDTEKKLIPLWKDTLDLRNVTTEDQFFELGGNSLKAMKLIASIQRDFNKSIQIKELFTEPTIKNLAAIIDATAVNPSEQIEITNLSSKEFYPLSSVQKRMYMLHKLDPASLNYNISTAIEIEGKVNVRKLQGAIHNIIKRHESLRTYFDEVNGKLVQKIEEPFKLNVQYSQNEDFMNEKEFLDKEVNNFIKPFDLNVLPLMRVKIVKLEQNKHVLLLDAHHIIFDGASAVVFLHELLADYNELEIPAPKVQYKDYMLWKSQVATKAEKNKKEKFWRSLYQNNVPVLTIETDFPRPVKQTFNGNNISFVLDENVGDQVEKLCLTNKATPYMFFLAALNVLLAKYSNQEDIVIGTAIEGRNHLDINNLIGMFVNTIPLRNQPESHHSFIEFLSLVKEGTLNAFEHSDYSLEELLDLLDVDRSAGRNPLFDVLFTFQNNLMKEFNFRDLDIKSYEIKKEGSKVDLFFEISQEKQFQCNIEYNSDLFTKETIERMAEHFKQIVASICRNPDAKLSEIEMITEAEKQLILHDFKVTKADYPKEKTIVELFEEQAAKNSDRIAVKFETEALTYNELNQRANQLARVLREKGIKDESIVGLMVGKSLELVVGILGILKAGGAYLPIDPKLPEDRKDYMIKDSGLELLITSNTYKRTEVESIIISLEDHSIFNGPSGNLPLINKSKDLAYIIYTSGTTGHPKGVMVEHRNVVSLMINDQMEFDFSEKDVWTMFHSPSFDFSVWEMYGALLYGGKLVIVSDLTAKETAKYLSLLKGEKVTVLNQTPTAFYNLMKIELQNFSKELCLSYIIFGGEALKSTTLDEWLKKYPETKLINMYGITETTVHVTFKEIGEKEVRDGASNIGKPIPTLTTLIVNKNLNVQPIGIPGELCVSGAGVTRGYLNREQLTKERFLQNPYSDNEKMYRSGDLVKLLPNGEIEYMGRIDHQVKIRGFRIELGEIENRLVSHECIKEAVLIAKEDEQNQKYLCAYIVCQKALDKSELKNYLKECLPDYMIPSYFMEMNKIPLTNNGKVNRNALPEPDDSGLITSNYEVPQTAIQKELATIWIKVLKVNSVGIHDNFFNLGGHSLKATVVISEIHKVFHIEVPLKQFFMNPTILGLSSYIETTAEDPYETIEPSIERDFYETSSVQKRMYTFQQVEKTSTAYNMPGILKLEGEVHHEKLENAFKQLVQRHEGLRTYFETVDGEIVQKVQSFQQFCLEREKIRETDISEIVKTFIQPFELDKTPLFRVKILENNNGEYLFIDMHHIISDGVSMSIFIKELTKLYNGEILKPLRLQYKDFSQWQNAFLLSGGLEKQALYWKNRFQGNVPVLHLPYDYERPPKQSFIGEKIFFQLDKKTTVGLKNVAKEQEVTLHMLLLTAFNILLSKYSGQEDIVVGVPVAGRTHADLQNIIGVFVNTLAIRNLPVKEKAIKDFIMEVKENSIQAYDNQGYQLEELIRAITLKREQGRNPLFDVLFDMTDADIYSDIKLNDGILKPKIFENGIAKFDLMLVGLERKQNIEMYFEYSSQLFKKTTIDRAIRDFKTIINNITTNLEITLSQISIRTEEEKEFLLQEEKVLDEFKNQDFSFTF